MPQHAKPEHELVEAEGVLERADLGDPVERAHVRRQPRRDADVIDRGGFQRHDVVRGVVAWCPGALYWRIRVLLATIREKSQSVSHYHTPNVRKVALVCKKRT